MVNLSQSQIAVPGIDESQLATVVAGLANVRLEFYDAGTITLQPFNGQGIYVNGEYLIVTVTSTFASVTDFLVDSDGVPTVNTPAASTLYYVYAASDGGATAVIVLSATAPTALDTGIWVLNSTGTGLGFRFVGAVATDGTTAFRDDSDFRGVASVFNPSKKTLFICPNYADDAADTTYSVNVNGWTAVGSGVTFIMLHTAAPVLHGCVYMEADATRPSQFGISAATGFATSADPLTATRIDAGLIGPASVTTTIDPPATFDLCSVVTANIVGETQAAAATWYADFAAAGASADPAATFLQAWVIL